MPCALFDRPGYWPGVRGHALEPRTTVDPGQSLHPCLALEAMPDPLPPGEPVHRGPPRGTHLHIGEAPLPSPGLLRFAGCPHSHFSQGDSHPPEKLPGVL